MTYGSSYVCVLCHSMQLITHTTSFHATDHSYYIIPCNWSLILHHSWMMWAHNVRAKLFEQAIPSRIECVYAMISKDTWIRNLNTNHMCDYSHGMQESILILTTDITALFWLNPSLKYFKLQPVFPIHQIHLPYVHTNKHYTNFLVANMHILHKIY